MLKQLPQVIRPSSHVADIFRFITRNPFESIRVILRRMNYFLRNITQHNTYNFILIPKVACRAIAIADMYISNCISKEEIQGLPSPSVNIFSLRKERFKKITSLPENQYAFVRDPYARLTSVYKDKILSKNIDEDHSQQSVLGTQFPINMRFSDFIIEVCRTPDFFANEHIRSQHTFLYSRNKAKLNTIGFFETLQNDFMDMCTLIGIKPFNLPHIGKSKPKSSNIDLSPDLKHMIYKRYEVDFSLFGYQL